MKISRGSLQVVSISTYERSNSQFRNTFVHMMVEGEFRALGKC